MNEQPSGSVMRWWQRPQPIWLSMVMMLTVLVGWNLAEAKWVQGETNAAVTSSAEIIPYQGFLTNANGQPLSGNQTIVISLYTVSMGGAAVWGPETHTNVPVTNGLFNISLGSKTAGGIPPAVWNSGSLYVQLAVNGEILTPREPILAPIRTLQLLGSKTAHPDIQPSETVEAGWHVAKGANSQDRIEVTVTTQGGPIFVSMALRHEPSPHLSNLACGIYVYNQNNQEVTRAVLDSSGGSTLWNYGCSGSYLFDLPAGTYTFQAAAYTPSAITFTWTRHRQIVVFEYR